MSELHNRLKTLLAEGEIKMIIGLGNGSGGRIRPMFVTKESDVDKLLTESNARINLSVYITKHSVKTAGKVAILANDSALKGVLRLHNESQVDFNRLLVIGLKGKGEFTEFAGYDELFSYAKTLNLTGELAEDALYRQILAMGREERWNYWITELTKCIKCYACRAACPMCYCTRCTVENNQPQWIPVATTPIGNLEWHIMRAMHLSGRCVDCSACGEACPLDLNVHLLTRKITDDIQEIFGITPAEYFSGNNVLSSFKPDDHENFIR